MTEKRGKETLPSAHNQQHLAKSADMVRQLDASGMDE
jgi:hypothetical protein